MSDAERLDVYDGFLLIANLDARLDRFLIGFSDYGHLLIPSSISAASRKLPGLDQLLRLRGLANERRPYLRAHRERYSADG